MLNEVKHLRSEASPDCRVRLFAPLTPAPDAGAGGVTSIRKVRP